MILAAGLFNANKDFMMANNMTLLGVLLFPLIARAFGIIASIIGVMSVKTNDKEDPHVDDDIASMEEETPPLCFIGGVPN